ncbi:tetratricopeptide repeat protein 19, mitochondrial isoform X4 [Anolis carolinensis]|uniref:tetratricopeptide repeat protein 19, mitochondrial isoform X4 n=1 Tax=Anolis carolinensis TaxID=28377 RepID=UPI002F2B78D5
MTLWRSLLLSLPRRGRFLRAAAAAGKRGLTQPGPRPIRGAPEGRRRAAIGGTAAILGGFGLSAFSLFSQEAEQEEKEGKEEEEAKEGKQEEEAIIFLLKKAKLSIMKGEMEEAERILHEAARMAQKTENTAALIYTYDTMANLALSRGQMEQVSFHNDEQQKRRPNGAGGKALQSHHEPPPCGKHEGGRQRRPRDLPQAGQHLRRAESGHVGVGRLRVLHPEPGGEGRPTEGPASGCSPGGGAEGHAAAAGPEPGLLRPLPPGPGPGFRRAEDVRPGLAHCGRGARPGPPADGGSDERLGHGFGRSGPLRGGLCPGQEGGRAGPRDRTSRGPHRAEQPGGDPDA